MPADYISTARALSLSPTPRSSSHARPFTFARPQQASSPSARLSALPRRPPKRLRARILDTLSAAWRTVLRAFLLLSPRNRVLALLAAAVLSALGALFLAYSGQIFTALGPLAESWRGLAGGWVIVWAAVFLAAFPPMIGYSTATTVAGFVFGFPHAWPVVATASTAGSLAAFVASRTVLSGYVDRLVGGDRRFVALGQVLRREGIGMLTMIRLCPLPYSLSNGFLATIPSIGPLSFTLSTALATPKLLVHVFIGSRLALLAEQDSSMPASTKALNYISMAVGAGLGATIGWLIYRRTMARAAEIALETAAEEGAALAPSSSPRPPGEGRGGYFGGPADPGDVLADVDDISLWDGDGMGAYWDEGEESNELAVSKTASETGSRTGSTLGVKNGNGRG